MLLTFPSGENPYELKLGRGATVEQPGLLLLLPPPLLLLLLPAVQGGMRGDYRVPRCAQPPAPRSSPQCIAAGTCGPGLSRQQRTESSIHVPCGIFLSAPIFPNCVWLFVCVSVCLYVCVRARACVSTEQCTPLDATMWLCLVFFYLFWTCPLNSAALPLCLLVRDE